MMKIWLKSKGSARATKTVVLIKPPYPEREESVFIHGKEWIVTRTKDVDGFEMSFPRKASGPHAAAGKDQKTA